jgi:ATP-dependent DNA ligase
MADQYARLSLPLGTAPMEAKLVAEIPDGPGWQYEPKWDGFRCLAFRDGEAVELMSKSGKPLARYFPEIAEELSHNDQKRFIVDGELILPQGQALSFEALQMRLHPAPSRIAKLSHETPAQLMLFYCLQVGARALAGAPLSERRAQLETFVAKAARPLLRLSPMTEERHTAQRWLERSGGALDGIVAKRRDEAYRPGERAMFKRKVQRSADCVVGGFRYDTAGTTMASLLLGLYDAEGRLHHVGFTSSFSAVERAELTPRLEALKGPSAFDGRAPGGVSRWNRGKSTDWVALRPELVAEVGYDQVTGDRFRHGATLLRWRTDKAPEQCQMDQFEPELRPAELFDLLAKAAA